MKITVQIVIDAQDGTPPATEQVAAIARDDLTMASAGLALAEAHEVLSGIQHHLVTAQAAAAAVAGRHCGSCGRARARKDTRHIVLRTLFGTLRLESPRFKACPCAGGGPATVSPVAALLPERTTPELLLWEARYAALTSYGAAATLLSEAFPLGRTLQPTAVRQQVERTATRLEDELGEERFSFIDTCPARLGGNAPPRPAPGRRPGRRLRPLQPADLPQDGWFEAVTGTSTPGDGGPAKTFAYVQTYDAKPKRRLYELLRSQGMQDNQQVVFLTDGGEDVRDLPRYLNPQAEHYLDWFHITMRLTVLRQMTRSLPPRPADRTMTTTRPGSRTPARPTGTWSGSSTSCGTATPSAPCRSSRTSATTSRSPAPPPTPTTSSARSSSGSASSAPTSAATARRSRTTASATAAASRSPPPPPRPPSTRSSAAAWSRSSRCAGRPAAPTCSCRSAPASSTTTSPPTSPAGTPDSPAQISELVDAA